VDKTTPLATNSHPPCGYYAPADPIELAAPLRTQ
jgi:hypothetical protein